MDAQMILAAYKAGRLSTAEVKEQLLALKAQTRQPFVNGAGKSGESNHTPMPLSEGQQGLWVLHKMVPQMSAYNVPIALRIARPLQPELWRQACHHLVERFPILQTVIQMEAGEPVQVIAHDQLLCFEVEDIQTLSAEAIIPHLKAKAKVPFVLEEGPLWRVQCFVQSETESILLLTIHHIIVDGTSAAVLVNALLQIYQTLLRGEALSTVETAAVDTPAANYADFVTWQQNLLGNAKGTQQRAYWQEQLAGELPMLSLPLDRQRPPRQRFAGDTYQAGLTAEQMQMVQQLAQSSRVSLATVFLAIFKLLLARYSGQTELLVGTPTLGRTELRFAETVGFFMNMVAIRSHLNADASFLSYLSELHLTLVDAVDHAELPFAKVVEALSLLPDPTVNPIFQAAFFFQNFAQPLVFHRLEQAYQDSLPFTFMNEIQQEGEYDLILEIIEGEAECQIQLKYNPDIFDRATIARMMTHYQSLVDAIVAAPEKTLADYQLLHADELQTILVDWNATQRDYPEGKCIHQFFEEQVKRTPDATAVALQTESLTYRELDERANQLAHYLHAIDVGPGSFVGICLERSPEMLVGLLGILKAGAAYIPLDPAFPAQRLAYILQDAGATTLLTQQSLLNQLPDHATQIVCLDTLWPTIATYPTTPVDVTTTAEQLAYLIYTSGSTGNPKGVRIAHQSVVNFLTAMQVEPGLQAQDRMLAVTTIAFDIAVLELFLPLTVGAQVILIDHEVTANGRLLADALTANQVTAMQATPVTWRLLLEAGWSGDAHLKALCGGEALPRELANRLVEKVGELWNMYGPTETTIWSTCQRVTVADGPVPIGQPIANTQVYVLDEQLHSVPVGVTGGLYIGGAGLAQGYHNQPERTEASFIDNPFQAGTKLYKTGDMARWRLDQSSSPSLAYLGRLDHQVKIRGFRIELGEIEQTLLQQPEIREAVVLVQEDNHDDSYLSAYYRADQATSARELRSLLALSLPEYMIPARYHQVDAMPLTPNGKIDRKRLAKRKVTPTPTVSTALPATAIERQVATIWQTVLEQDTIDRDERFFDIGGTSLSIVRMVEQIKAELGTTLDLNQFEVTAAFHYPTIRELSHHLSTLQLQESAPPVTENADRLIVENIDAKGEAQAAASQHASYPMTEAFPAYYQDAIAIIGISCHFPDAPDYRSFWDNLKRGHESTHYLTDEELDAFALLPHLVEHPEYRRYHAGIANRDHFDADFFGIPAHQVALMDPQFRLLLQHCWSAIEDAGYIPQQIPETGIFLTGAESGYQNAAPIGQQSETPEMLATTAYPAWLMRQWGTMPTMIAYQMNLKGPALFVHSNCSSGLSAVQIAYQNLLANECKLALVGASAIRSVPGYHYQPGMNFSGDGQGRTFDAAADGFVPGEGVGVVLLKRLPTAIADGDPIYALLRGIHLNNDGSEKAGFYAPSVQGQIDVIEKTLRATGIDPTTIDYLEAHGTGTKLGDPIEIAALTAAYREFTAKTQFCGISSVKTNIGHLDTAAGLAGLIKLALALHHRAMPASLHFDSPNPQIDFANSPFYVVTEHIEWAASSHPRRAAISSLGIGGTNAHAILEEWRRETGDRRQETGDRRRETEDPRKTLGREQLIVLSAKNEERLWAYADKLLAYLEAYPGDSLTDITYTLQVGRVAMAERLAFVVTSREELVERLRQYVEKQDVQKQDSIQGLYCGNAGSNQQQTGVEQLIGGEAGAVFLATAIRNQELARIAQLWVLGVEIDWSLLYPTERPQRISLPTYPFAPERHALPQTVQRAGALGARNGATEQRELLHPLLHRNLSTATEYQFCSVFSGVEFFLAEHIIQEEQIFPAVAYLEMARAAGTLAFEGGVVTQLRDVIWIRPLVVQDEPRAVHMELYPNDGGWMAFRIRSNALDEPVIHCQGKIDTALMTAPAPLDIMALQARCPSILTGEDCYQMLDELGEKLGPTFRALKELRHNEQEVLARIEMPIEVTERDYQLHPSLMDAALLATMGLMTNQSKRDLEGFPLPFAIEEVNIYSQLPTQVYAYVQYSMTAGTAAGELVNDIIKYDITLLDSEGNVHVSLKSFSRRPLMAPAPSLSTRSKVQDDTHSPHQPAKPLRAAGEEPIDLVDKLQTDLAKAIAEGLSISLASITGDKEMSDYGLDSIKMTELANRLNQTHQLDLIPTLFFEHRNLASLSAYLVETYEDRLQEHYQAQSKINAQPVAPSLMESLPAVPAPMPLKATTITNSTERQNDDATDAIAIIGMSGRMPASPDLATFWQHLVAGQDLITEIPPDRWDWQAYYGDPQKETNKTNVKWGGFVPDIDKFDAAFFKISPREAELMDPQQRIVLETVWHCIEDAGYRVDALAGTQTGIFVGVAGHDYFELMQTRDMGIEAQAATGASHAVLANRVSFLFDFHGPSEPIDTACSSSLVAIHRAVEAIRNGTCELAIAGGVNAMLTPTIHIAFNKAGMLTEDGRCKTFDQRANGYVRAEGVGIILLKPLAQAEADGDHIYAVIRSTAENHGGQANSLTAPNPQAQADLLVNAYQKAQIDPTTVSYIETHGTGTPLGDPIEINALKHAFATLYQREGKATPTQPHCGVGAVKTNIGHLETAAGIAGVLKVLLALQQQTLPATIHLTEQNSYIDLTDSPFYLVTETQPWQPLLDAAGQPLPRRAGVSSFGYGGANAHVVLEEYQQSAINKQQPTSNSQSPRLIVLSAKNEERLRAYAQDLLTFLEQSTVSSNDESTSSSTLDLTHIAYTLQVGRTAMAERLALVVATVEEAIEQLRTYLAAPDVPLGIYRGNSAIHTQRDQGIDAATEIQLVSDAVQNRDFNKLAQLWVLGHGIDWSLLYPEQMPRRISLPTYPFAKVRHWLPEANPSVGKGTAAQPIGLLHPLVHRNISDLEEQRFRSTFTGSEFFLHDHRVQGERVLPGVAYLEMSRAAGTLALREQQVTQLRDVVWLKPIVVQDESAEITISLHPDEHSNVAFEVSSQQAEQHVLHSQGKLTVGELTRPAPLDLTAIQSRMNATLASATCYNRFADYGLNYGPTFQAITALHYNEDEALAQLQLPAQVASASYGLHPTLMDAALQTVMGLALGQARQEQSTLYLPFAVQEVNIYDSLPAQAYAYVSSQQTLHGQREGNGVAGSGETVVKYDITLTDSQGVVCATMQGYTARALPNQATVSRPESNLLYGTPTWQVQPLEPVAEATTENPAATLFLIGLEPAAVQAISTLFDQAEVVVIETTEVTTLIHQIWSHLQTLVMRKPREPHSLLVVATDVVDEYLYTPLAGLFKTAHLEQPNIQGKIITVAVSEVSAMVMLLRHELHAERVEAVEIHYDSTGTRSTKALQEITLTTPARTTYLQSGGVYWITGGLGGLGRIFAQHLLAQGKGITVVLSGRSALNEKSEQMLGNLHTSEGRAVYHQADVSDRAAVERLVQTIRQQYGRLNGIIHSAGILRDGFILNKTASEFDAVLAPKVVGTLNIDAATQNEDLDFLVLFSSISSLLGNIGQADYATANVFLDSFAHDRQTLVAAGQRAGRTLAINWPLWAEGGMTVDAQTEERLYEATGIKPLTTAQGLQAFDQLLTQREHDQVLVVQGNQSKVRQQFGLTHAPDLLHSPRQPAQQATKQTPLTNGNRQAQVEAELIKLCVTVLKVDEADLDTQTNLADYGVDSILMMSMLHQLEETYGETIAPTAIAEYQTISALASYLISEGIAGQDHTASAVETTANLNGDQGKPPASSVTINGLVSPSNRRTRFRTVNNLRIVNNQSKSGKVAIIGQACRLPQSPTLEQFWENLAAGRDLVTPIPADRWQAEAIYSAEPGQRHKSYANHGAFIDGIGEFDADFFGIRPEEAIAMDPQQRIMLELTQVLWDHAGYRAEEVAGTKTSVFIGAKDNDYLRNHYDLVPPSAVQHTIVNATGNMIAARLSDFYDLTGTAQVIDTACSSSLVAIHDACQSILNGESEMAIAGGIYVMVSSFGHISFSQAKVLSPDGKSYVFDERANGFVLGEGGGLVLLKEYDAAVRDGDQICGVILGSAVNNDGQTMGVTVPNQVGQQVVIAEALKRSQVNAADIGYLEAHGTGTLLGDPIEIRAATEAYRQATAARQFCAVGSVKSNLGHTMMAAGVTGLIKLVLSLQHRQIPPTLHCETPHPRFNFAESPFYPNTQLRDWEPHNGRRIGAISSFGFGGTNCHLIVEEGGQIEQTRQPLLRTQFQRRHYWLGQELPHPTINGTGRHGHRMNGNSWRYNRTLLQQFIDGELDEQDVEALLKVDEIGG